MKARNAVAGHGIGFAAAAGALLLGGLCLISTAAAQSPRADSCAYARDGECDEPSLGTGLCATGTDTSDCVGVYLSGDSCASANDGTCDEGWLGTGRCAEGTDVSDCAGIYADGQTCASAWDGVWGLMIKIAIGIDIKILGKAELFKGLTGVLLGPLLRWLGVIPTDRHAANGLVGQIVDRFRDQGRFWLILAPEGTRRRVEKWRSGFWHIAQQAGVPIQCCYFHYPERTVGVGELFHTTGDLDADMAHLRSYYKAFQGLRRGA